MFARLPDIEKSHRKIEIPMKIKMRICEQNLINIISLSMVFSSQMFHNPVLKTNQLQGFLPPTVAINSLALSSLMRRRNMLGLSSRNGSGLMFSTLMALILDCLLKRRHSSDKTSRTGILKHVRNHTRPPGYPGGRYRDPTLSGVNGEPQTRTSPRLKTPLTLNMFLPLAMCSSDSIKAPGQAGGFPLANPSDPSDKLEWRIHWIF